MKGKGKEKGKGKDKGKRKGKGKRIGMIEENDQENTESEFDSAWISEVFMMSEDLENFVNNLVRGLILFIVDWRRGACDAVFPCATLRSEDRGEQSHSSGHRWQPDHQARDDDDVGAVW